MRWVEDEAAELRDDRRRAMRIGNELTLETQTLEEMTADLVRLVKEAREQRDDAIARLATIGAQVAELQLSASMACEQEPCGWCAGCKAAEDHYGRAEGEP